MPLNSNLVRAAAVAALLAMTAGCQTTPVTPLAWKLPAGVKTVEANGYPFAYTESGTGPTVLLVHGAMCDYRCWRADVQAALSGQYRVVTVSLRHFYPEPWDGSGSTYSVAQHANDLAALAAKMSPPVRIVAHSYGGAVAFETARRHPELVSKLVLAEASTDGLVPPPSEQQLEQRRKFAVAVENMLKTKGAGAAMEFGVDGAFGKGTFAGYPEAIQAVHRDNPWSLIVPLKSPPPTHGTCADFGALKMPVLLATGEKTPPRYKQLVATQGKCLPSAKTVVIPNAGHGAVISQPTFIAALRDFLR